MPSPEALDDPPLVWALLARRPGDNAQIETLARALGLPFAVKPLVLRKGLEALPNLRRGGSLFSYDASTQAALREGPAPRLVVAAGKRSAPAALWLKARHGARLLHIGRTWAPGAWFDAVLTTPQYGQPPGPNVVRNLFPLTEAAPGLGALAADLCALPRPRLLIVAGGDAAGLAFGETEARALARHARERQREAGGSLLVATSPRTSPAAAAALREGVSPAGTRLVSIFGEGPNRYRDFLGAADAVIVTEDSVSMVAEAAATGRPVEIFRLRELASPLRAFSSSRLGRRAAAVGLTDSGREISAYMRMLEGGGWLAGDRAPQKMAAERSAAVALGRRLARDG